MADEHSRERTDAAIAEWGDALAAAIRREDRARLDSPLFDIQRRQVIGYECYFRLAPVLVRELVAAGLTPELVAERMRRVIDRPYHLQIFELIVNPLLAREQRVLSGESVADHDATELPGLAAYVSELVRAYRRDSALGPTEGNDATQQVIEDDDVERCRAALGPAGEEDVRAVERAAGTIGLHSVLLHGEHRDGIFDHGPYPGPDGTQLLVREINDLANDYLPWSTEEVRLSVSGVAAVYAVRDVGLRFDLFGGVSTDPADLGPRVEAIGLLARRDGELVELSRADFEGVVEETRHASRALYADVTQWEPPRRILYGKHLYANHFRPYTVMLDSHTGGTRGAELLSEFERIGERVGQGLLGRSMPSVVEHQAKTKTSSAALFTPVTA